MSCVITRRVFCLGTVGAGLLLSLPARAAPTHGIAMHGIPALPADFPHLPYADPDAPKGGTFALGFPGSFDSLNPFIVKGNAPRGLSDTLYGNNVWDTLLQRSADEAFSLYGLLAEGVEMPADRAWVEFTLNPRAAFSDGQPVTVDDVLFTVDLLKNKGRPVYKRRFDKVVSVDRVGERTLRFSFADGADRELPLLIGGFTPILPRHAIDAATFDQSSMKPLLGSGPYVIDSIDEGRQVVLKRNPDYWAKDLPIKRGLDNFDEIRIEYFKDATAYFEAFKTGTFDLYMDSDPGHWAKAYDFPAVRDGRVVMEKVKTGTPKGMTGFVFNTRRELFKDIRVRQALTLLFDFEAVNRTLYYGAYARTGSYFEGSSLSALGVPASEAEKALLAPYQDLVLPEVMAGTYAPPVSDGSGRDRKALRAALDLMNQAGWKLDGRRLVDANGQAFAFEFMAKVPDEERLALAYQATLKLIGIDMAVRLVDSTQYYDRQKTFDFDMLQMIWTASLSPGNEQVNRWSQKAAVTEGTFNYAGASSPAIDAMIDALLAATEREEFETAVRALDRLLISGVYCVPLYHLPEDLVARWVRIRRPEATSIAGIQPSAWWADAKS
ncbi:extracellular solute-binding protein [Pleomorphomonas koreensis]|uniref:extracellular solute-binding protein n=1 Tax=Pleomorphomonas koreensis TaxID=257440 RepID=UPI0004298868|nr:extracellular solute-binding protein [Pleomorphomonas koreensis]